MPYKKQESLANANVKRATAVPIWRPFAYLEMGSDVTAKIGFKIESEN